MGDGKRQEVRQAGVDPVIAAGEVVAELMRQQDRHQRDRKSQAVQEQDRMGLDRDEDVQVLLQFERLLVWKLSRQYHTDERGGAKGQPQASANAAPIGRLKLCLAEK